MLPPTVQQGFRWSRSIPRHQASIPSGRDVDNSAASGALMLGADSLELHERIHDCRLRAVVNAEGEVQKSGEERQAHEQPAEVVMHAFDRSSDRRRSNRSPAGWRRRVTRYTDTQGQTGTGGAWDFESHETLMHGRVRGRRQGGRDGAQRGGGGRSPWR